jgi:hypothetical protein
MTDPTDVTSSEHWRLRLDDGDTLEIQPARDSSEGDGKPEIVLTLPAWRAHDLATVLDRYGRIARIFQEHSDVWTEDSLVRGLRDAAAAVSGPSTARPQRPSRVGDAERGRAMVRLQDARPELTHEQMAAVVDAAAWWFDNGEDDKVVDLLDAVATDDRLGGDVYVALLGSTKLTEVPRPGAEIEGAAPDRGRRRGKGDNER